MTSNKSTQPPVVSFAEKPQIKVLRTLIPIAAVVAPRLTARLCLNLFLTPGRHRTPKWELERQSEATRSEALINGKRVALFHWGSGSRKVLLCHGWGGRGSQMADFVPALTAAGFAVIAFDAPAHGASDGQRTDMMEYSALIGELVRSLGPIHAIVGHSFGAGNTLFAKKNYALQVERVALLGCFSDGEWVINRFAEILRIPQRTLAAMKRIHESRHGGRLQWSGLKMVDMAQKQSVPILLVHDEDDKEIPYFHAEEFAAAEEQNITVYTTKGLGHRRILRDKAVIQTVCQFVSAPI